MKNINALNELNDLSKENNGYFEKLFNCYILGSKRKPVEIKDNTKQSFRIKHIHKLCGNDTMKKLYLIISLYTIQLILIVAGMIFSFYANYVLYFVNNWQETKMVQIIAYVVLAMIALLNDIVYNFFSLLFSFYLKYFYSIFPKKLHKFRNFFKINDACYILLLVFMIISLPKLVDKNNIVLFFVTKICSFVSVIAKSAYQIKYSSVNKRFDFVSNKIRDLEIIKKDCDDKYYYIQRRKLLNNFLMNKYFLYWHKKGFNLNDLKLKLEKKYKKITSLLSDLADKYPTLDIQLDFAIIEEINKIDQIFSTK